MGLTLPGYLGPAALAPAFERAFADGQDAVWDGLCEEIGPRVLAFPLFSPAACARLLQEIDRRTTQRDSAGTERHAPNSMHAHGTSLGEIGMGNLLEDLRKRWLAPLAGRHFPDAGGLALDGEHGFLAEYGSEADEELGYHVDDSAVTLNVCLGEDFSGAELYFRGLRCDRHRQSPWTPSEAFEVEHETGRAILHAGRHRHGVHPIRRGRRRNLILWLQSSAATEAARECQPWCGEYRGR